MPSTGGPLLGAVELLLAALLTRSCCQAGTPAPQAPSAGSSRWATLRQCWLDLAQVQQGPQTSLMGLGPEQEAGLAVLGQRHRDALDALVAAGELRPAVASDIAAAMEQAIAHHRNSSSMCYIALPAVYFPRMDLLRQLTLLEEVAGQGAIDPATVEQVRAALEQDIEWLGEFAAGRVPSTAGRLVPDADSLEAARLLVELLLGR